MNTAQDIERYEELAARYDSDALLNLALAYYNGDGIEENDEKAFELFVAATWEGNIEAPFYVGLCYRTGTGVEKNMDFAVAYFEHGTRLGSINATGAYGIYLSDLDSNEPCNFPKNPYYGNIYMEEAAKNGHRGAMFQLGYNLSERVGGIYDKEKGLYWTEQAAKNGHVQAMFNCAVMYREKNYDNEAGTWFNEAAQNGHPEAGQWLQQYSYSRLSGKWRLR